ncbi:hypothetical protein OS190_10330 [Sulfitobacter sp. F26204]|uniref:DUF6778 family protein n=1 Tax=Sulfitobacter sp. F26204 TaxID=2996014 RepID=UPI00225E1C54|nr:DUF6778 family protein [Sulfitobacter sp. F26204]MCX7559964.1 hypothetical protein [Sulfitobacter sp. F26204]
MQTLKLFTAMTLGVSVAACGNVPDIASRNAPYEVTPPSDSQPASQPLATGNTERLHAQLPMTVTQININVPRTLTVSEANSYYPKADIVWRGDPIGDRYAQITQIFDTAFRAGTKDLSGPTGVILDVELVRFHSVTEKTRYSVGGVHNMVFNLTVRRASTGAALAPTRQVTADLPALGGRSAIEAERKGQTQKVRVTNFLAQAIRQELARFVSA